MSSRQACQDHGYGLHNVLTIAETRAAAPNPRSTTLAIVLGRHYVDFDVYLHDFWPTSAQGSVCELEKS
jgi:hypothetical protein